MAAFFQSRKQPQQPQPQQPQPQPRAEEEESDEEIFAVSDEEDAAMGAAIGGGAAAVAASGKRKRGKTLAMWWEEFILLPWVRKDPSDKEAFITNKVISCVWCPLTCDGKSKLVAGEHQYYPTGGGGEVYGYIVLYTAMYVYYGPRGHINLYTRYGIFCIHTISEAYARAPAERRSTV